MGVMRNEKEEKNKDPRTKEEMILEKQEVYSLTQQGAKENPKRIRILFTHVWATGNPRIWEAKC